MRKFYKGNQRSHAETNIIWQFVSRDREPIMLRYKKSLKTGETCYGIHIGSVKFYGQHALKYARNCVHSNYYLSRYRVYYLAYINYIEAMMRKMGNG